MSDIAIRIENLGKLYKIGALRSKHDTLRDRINDVLFNPFKKLAKVAKAQRNPIIGSTSFSSDDHIWALKDVSFEVKRGEVIGIIGRNGAGKTTLLKILSRITEPTQGHAEIRGRVGSLLEVGTGFHPELTGRENIYLNGAILGMKKAEIAHKFDDIVGFAEIEKFIDTPVKRYSSGMYVRLAFAVAAHLEQEILLVDEVLAVGDAAFQKKCLGKMGDVAKEGKTILFVSHNMAAVENHCREVILLDDGNLIRQGDPQQIINYYLKSVLPAVIEDIPLAERRDRSGNGKVRLTGFHIEDSNGNRVSALRSGHDAAFTFHYEVCGDDDVHNVDIGFGLYDIKGQLLFVLYSSYVGQVFETIPRSGMFYCNIPTFPLTSGRFRIGARVTVGGDEADWVHDGIGYVDVEAGDFYGTGKIGFGECPFIVFGTWSVIEPETVNLRGHP